jgi:CRP/FNR family transcriptional regulator
MTVSTEKTRVLERFPFFGGIPDEVLSDVLAQGHVQKFEKDMHLYWEGDACHGIAFILDGEIRVYKAGETGREITLYEIGPGETCILNASCILSGRKYPANAAAILDGAMFMLPAPLFKKLIASREEAREFVYAVFSQRLTAVMTLLEEVVFRKVDERLMDYLVEKAENDVVRATHQTIANDLGTAREVVSRILKDFERRGNVRLERNTVHLLSF